jgi:hypothetical protein
LDELRGGVAVKADIGVGKVDQLLISHDGHLVLVLRSREAKEASRGGGAKSQYSENFTLNID